MQFNHFDYCKTSTFISGLLMSEVVYIEDGVVDGGVHSGETFGVKCDENKLEDIMRHARCFRNRRANDGSD